MIVIIDYGMGNLKNVYNALKYLNIPSKISNEISEIKNADKLILPGVGAFNKAMYNLNDMGLTDAIKNKVNGGTPLLGICLGMQMIFQKGYENGECDGLGFIDGEVKLLEPKEKAKIPHIGWNRLEYNSKNDLIKGLDENSFVYYVHSYAATNVKDENLIGFSNYGGIKVPSIVCNDNIYGTQFHPEKSGEVGLRILKNFGEVIK
ncbi:MULTISPECIES: imidazole glycerol phosphate synthase subunit HisH [unclassified Clostridium]|uniref:imidazole glycerol phosphate synthase subunit HisH n=1 Tax=unclassified Clostridium TaxID=2614128 RepID=UPI001896D36D|nr:MULTISPECIES: imidazole glycerol phosphate synthase subunit HisH [unclassified Clostridium]MBP3916675.1 imidazole glycerol phosphate synthase subunit HisH [Clostridium sp.]MEE0933540.1 imidazole glycerol phosphate synthase subunit HisH [Clostridium sp.]